MLTELAEIKFKRLDLLNNFIRASCEIFSVDDYLVFAHHLSDSYIQRESGEHGFLTQLYSMDVYKGIHVSRAGMDVDFTADNNFADFAHSIEALAVLPPNINPRVVLTILGAVLQESVVVIHSKDRSTLLSVISLVLSLLKPLIYPYPIVPIVKSSMMSLLESPIPLLCGIVDGKDQDFKSTWRNACVTNPNSFHIQIEKLETLGTLPIDYFSEVILKDSSYSFSQCEQFHKDAVIFSKQKRSDQVYKNLEKWQSDECTCIRERLVEEYHKFIANVYLAPLNLQYLIRDHSKSFQDTMEFVGKRSRYPKKVQDALLRGQIYFHYLETVKSDSEI